MASKRLTALFLELARLDGLPGKEAPVANYVLSFLRNLGLPVQVDGSAAAALSNTGNVVCEVGGGGEFALAAHMDTLYPTAGTEPLVTADRISSGGKGPLGVDGRAGMAAILYALERAVHSGLPLKPFTAAFTTRAKGNMAGVKHLALPQRSRCAFVFGSELDPGAYTASSPGIALFSADILGRTSDAALSPESGISAITIAAKAISALSLGRHDAETTSNIGTIAGGVNTGIVPLAAFVRGQVRVSDAAKAPLVLDGFKAEFERSAAAAGGAVSFKWSWDYQPYRHAPGSEVLRLADWALRDSGLTPAPVVAPGGSEANALNAKGVAAVSFGIGARSPKQNDEHILLDHLAKASEIVSHLIKK
ncbi:MAG: M20/M25/M40 family metallo-hydrolase [Elusimicrobia bacterium]|nr:M20/M25/M40 family metallo-hydrolase [Elusimicrobiota bacterium]